MKQLSGVYKELLLLQEQVWELTMMLHKNGVITKEQATAMLEMSRHKKGADNEV